MSTQEQVAKLESLLARVNGRRDAPRTPAAKAPNVAAAAPVEAGVPATAPAVAAPPPVTVAPPPAAATTPPRSTSTAPRLTPPPLARPPLTSPPATSAPVVAKAPTQAPPKPEPVLADVEVEVEEGVAEVDLDGIDVGGSASLSDSVADLDTVAGRDEHELPASSRRPIQMQPPIDELADAPEATAPHPAPPESRRQVAIPPASDFEGDLLKSGVRAMPDVESSIQAGASATLEADVTRPAIGAGSPAVFHGELPVARPASFGELLDLTLAL